jgi:GAF domain-containing protein
VVPDVELFPGHIACDSLSRSEIVVPLPGRRGVLDLDSYQEAAFDAEDGELLAELLRRVESGK